MSKLSVRPRGSDRPTIQEINNYGIRNDVATEWYDLGVQLLPNSLQVQLDVIRNRNPTNAIRCTTQMFQYWLQVDVTASWNKLIEALRKINKHFLAKIICRKVLQEEPSREYTERKEETEVSYQRRPITRKVETHDTPSHPVGKKQEPSRENTERKEETVEYCYQKSPVAREVDTNEISSIVVGVERVLRRVLDARDSMLKDRERLVLATSPPDDCNCLVESVIIDENGGKLYSEKHAIIVLIPPGAIPSGVRAELKFGATLFAPVKFAKKSRPVSAIIWLCMNIALLKPMKIQMPHCVNIESKAQASYLTFAKAHHSPSSGDMMKIIDGGEVDINKSYGSIKVTHFCYYCIQDMDYDENHLLYHNYKAVLFCRRQPDNHTWQFEICVMSSLATCEEKTKQQYGERNWEHICILPNFLFNSLSDKISIQIDDDQFVNEAQVVIHGADYIDQKDIDFSEAIMDKQIKRDLLRRMNLREYPPRFRCEVVDVTRSKRFFAKPNILRYRLILGEKNISRNLIIPSLKANKQKTMLVVMILGLVAMILFDTQMSWLKILLAILTAVVAMIVYCL